MGHPEAHPGRQSQTGPQLRGCEPALGTEKSTGRWWCWPLEVKLGTGCVQVCSARSTCYEGHQRWRAPRLSPDLCSAGSRGEINDEWIINKKVISVPMAATCPG